LSENKYFGIDALYKKMSDPTPLELTYRTQSPTAYTNTLFLDSFSSSSFDLSSYITRTFFRDDIFLSIKSFNSYLENRINKVDDGWMSGVDVSIKYESVLGPFELGWSICGEQITSWTKLHIYL